MIVTKIQGGLGNQLFQYATGRALSIKYNTELKLDLSFFDNPEFRKVYRLNKFNLSYKAAKESDYLHLKNKKNNSLIIRILKRLGNKKNIFYHKKSHVLENDIIELFKTENKLHRDYYLDGWFANPDYFKGNREIILKEYNADHLLSPENKDLKKDIIRNNSVAVHIRRKDYLTNTYFKTLPKDYYERAMRQIKEEVKNPIFYFFSDDTLWVKEQFSSFQNIIIIENNSITDTIWSTVGDIADLMLMRLCKHQIIANSTFSWWGAWLNENPAKQVYYPALWYNNVKAQKQFEKNSFIPIEWIKVQF